MPGSPDGLFRLGVGAGGRGGSETAQPGVQRDGRDLLQALDSVQQIRFGSWFGFWYFNLQIWAQVWKTVIPCLKNILDSSKFNVPMII